MKSNIFIPKKCKVGFNTRTDTYTGKLGYIIYHDGKVWRKEPSWESWREKPITQEFYDAKKQESFEYQVKTSTKYYNESKNDPKHYNKQYWDKFNTLEEYLKESKLDSLENYRFHLPNHSIGDSVNPIEFVNEPLDGFVLNKKAGGYSSGWNHRQTYCRVYDPRGFEFEISIPNLLYILENATSTKGKGLEGKFVYGWDGKDLVLIPEEAPEFKEMMEFTAIQDLKVAKKDLKIGGVYLVKTGGKATYLGNFDYFGWSGENEGKKHWFYTENGYNKYTCLDLNTIKKYVEDTTNIAELLEGLEKDSHFKPKEILEVKYEIATKDWIKEEFERKYKNSYYSYGRQITIYTPLKSKKNAYKSLNLSKLDSKYIVTRGWRGESQTFNSFEELIKEYPIYKRIENKVKNGKES